MFSGKYERSVRLGGLGAAGIGQARLLYLREFHVGPSAWMYSTVQDALDAIAALTTPPSLTAPVMIQIHQGYYVTTAPMVIPEWVSVRGVAYGACHLYNEDSDLFVASGNNIHFENLIIEGSSTSFNCFDFHGFSRINMRRCDLLANGGVNTQRFIDQRGDTWHTHMITDCLVDDYIHSSYAVWFDNTSGACRYVDIEFDGVFVDTFFLTGYGGGFSFRSCQDVRFRNCKIRGGNSGGGSSSYFTGVRIERHGATGTAWAQIHGTTIEGLYGSTGAVAVYGEAGTHYILTNTDAIGALTAGTRTIRNSSV